MMKWVATVVVAAGLAAYVWWQQPRWGAEAAVRQALSDPEAAQFRSVRKAGQGWCGEVNARNRAGGYAGFRPFLVSGNAVAIDPRGLGTVGPAAEIDFMATLKAHCPELLSP